MIETLKDLIKKAAPTYQIMYDEAHMINVKADNIPYFDNEYEALWGKRNPKRLRPDKPEKKRWAYIEEFRAGRYNPLKAFPSKSTRAQIYFCQFTQMENDAETREAIRAQIEAEAVFPFIEAYKQSGLQPVENWGWGYPPARFDSNEVSVMLEFDFITTFCVPAIPKQNTDGEKRPNNAPCHNCG